MNVGRRFLITGTDADVGKTLIGCALAFAFRARGMRVGVMKSVETDCDEVAGELQPRDAIALWIAASSDLPLDLICPYRYRSSLVPVAAADADGLPPPDFDRILRDLGQITALSDVVLVEGTGGIATPITWEKNYADLALAADLETIVVVANRSGGISAGLLTLHYAQSRGLRISGYILSDVEPDETLAMRANAETLVRLTSAPYLGRVRHREPVGLSIIERLL